MVGRTITLICGLIGVLIVSAFVIGLSHSISTGFAGFWGGLPFAIITAIVLAFVVYDFWDECVRKENNP
jgi:sterol desaturase/sphingolipid hydroxylase (fatty acid hydroxylase superfamily)